MSFQGIQHKVLILGEEVNSITSPERDIINQVIIMDQVVIMDQVGTKDQEEDFKEVVLEGEETLGVEEAKENDLLEYIIALIFKEECITELGEANSNNLVHKDITTEIEIIYLN